MLEASNWARVISDLQATNTVMVDNQDWGLSKREIHSSAPKHIINYFKLVCVCVFCDNNQTCCGFFTRCKLFEPTTVQLVLNVSYSITLSDLMGFGC